MSGWPARVVFATTNRGKLREVAEILAADGVTVVGVDEVVPGWSVVEDGATFAASAAGINGTFSATRCAFGAMTSAAVARVAHAASVTAAHIARATATGRWGGDRTATP